jgi:hypothetical protein
MAKKKSVTENTTTGAPVPTRRRAASAKTVAAKNAPTATTPANGREPTDAEIAEAAYFRHLNRGGASGDEFNDWVEAERELKQRNSR